MSHITDRFAMQLFNSDNRLYTWAYLWLLVPLIIFLLTWMRPEIGFPVTALLMWGLWQTPRQSAEGEEPLQLTRSGKLLLAGAATFIVWISGIGGYSWQNPIDHYWRNATLVDLMANSWPVVTDVNGFDELLVYYSGYWMVPALGGKLAMLLGASLVDGVEVGQLLMFLYGVSGLWLALNMAVRYLRKCNVVVVVVFLFFGALLIVPSFFYEYEGSYLKFMIHNRYYRGVIWPFFAYDIPWMLSTVFHQIIAAMLVMLLLLRHRDDVGVQVYTLALLLFFAPFMAVVLMVAVGIAVVRHPRRALTMANGAGVLVWLLLLAYYRCNLQSRGVVLLEVDSQTVGSFLLFLVLAVGVYLPFVWERVRKDKLFWLLLGATLPLMWVRVGISYDLAWRSIVPLLFYLMLKVEQQILATRTWRTLRSRLFVFVIALGMLWPLDMVVAELYYDAYYIAHDVPFRSWQVTSLAAEDTWCHTNFFAPVDTDHFYMKHLAPRPFVEQIAH